MVDAIVIGFAKYASYCGLIFMNKRHITKSIHLKNFYAYSIALRLHLVILYFAWVDKGQSVQLLEE